MKKIAIALATAGSLLAAGAVQAGNVYWSVGINLPPVGTVISNVPAPVYVAPPPVYVAPPPVYVAPPPVYVEPAPVVYMPPPRVVYRPVPVYAPPVVYRPARAIVHVSSPYGHKPRRHYHGEWRDRDRDGRHDEYGTPYREGRWVPADPRRFRHDR